MNLVVVLRISPVRMLQWTQGMLFTCAVLMLGYCGFVLADTFLFQQGERTKLEHLLVDRKANPSMALSVGVMGGLVGRMEIPRLGLSVMVVVGTGPASLRRAVGHIRGTALPGQQGNVGISGHRDTFFRPLRNIRRNDMIGLTTLGGEYQYRVVSTKIVPPSDVSVLDANGEETLTLVTCYPFYFIGSAPDRFIVRAVRIRGRDRDMMF